MTHASGWMRKAALAIAAIATAGFASAVSATAAHASGATGYDVSWPQCSDRFLPSGGSFGIAGVNDGLPWSLNPCFATPEWPWAQGTGTAAIYVNSANPAPHSSHYWPKSGSRDPALCINATSRRDPGCAYDYGWHAARDALSSAQTASGSATGVTSVAWWIDVETGNTWNGNGNSNAADIQGMIDYLRGAGIATVGVYSTAYQWHAITGGYSAASQASYQQKWSKEFTTAYGITASPEWLAGAGSDAQARSWCTSQASFIGTHIAQVQYQTTQTQGGTTYTFDADAAC